ncbi:MAG: T9SS type A sorting domain-containing protein, partial [Perlabentimonas sp.]
LFDDNWILLDNELAENLISLNAGQADGEQIGFTATVDELAKTIEISINEAPSNEQDIVLTLSNIIHDEDEVALNDISTSFTIGATNASLQNLADFNIFPNPSTGEFQIKLPETARVEKIDIYSVAGMHLFGKEITSTNSAIKLNIKQPQGVYIVKVTMENGEILTNRLIIE